MRINLINQYYNIQPKNNFCGSKKSNESSVNLPAYKMPDFETAKAYACIGLDSIDRTLSSTTIKDVKFHSEKSNNKFGTYMIALENLENVDTKDITALEIYKCRNNIMATVFDRDLNEKGKGRVKSSMSNNSVVFTLISEPKDMKEYIAYLNHLALDVYSTTNSADMFDAAKETLTDYYKENWDKIKNSKDDKGCAYSALKDEQSLEDVVKKIDEVKYEDYLKFVNKFKNKDGAYIMISLPEDIYNNSSKKEEIEKTALDNIIVNGKFEIVNDLHVNK